MANQAVGDDCSGIDFGWCGSSELYAEAVSSGSATDWIPWSAEAVAKTRAEGKPVFVDFTAKWCLSCQVNERVALEKPEVREAFEKAHVVKFKADWTEHDDAIANQLTSLGAMEFRFMRSTSPARVSLCCCLKR